jgi:hypothetical protein
VVEALFEDIILLHSVSVEKHPVVNFECYPRSFSRTM